MAVVVSDCSWPEVGSAARRSLDVDSCHDRDIRCNSDDLCATTPTLFDRFRRTLFVPPTNSGLLKRLQHRIPSKSNSEVRSDRSP